MKRPQTNEEILAANGLDDQTLTDMHDAMVKSVAVRLSDKTFEERRQTLCDIVNNFGLREVPERMALETLAADHLQAREDVKRLAAKVRKLATYHEAGDGLPLCWSETGCCVRPGGVPSRRCVEIRVLLSEVGQ